jgi:hypothetical protein
MPNMNWASWLQGLVASLGSAGAAIAGVLMGLNACPTGWELTKVAILPAILGFLLYIKQTPPPFGVTTTTLSQVSTPEKTTTEISTTKTEEPKPGEPAK